MEQVFTIIKWLNWAFALAFSLFSTLFIFYSIKEKEWRAAASGAFLFGGLSSGWILTLLWFKPHNAIIYILFLAFSFPFLLLLITPLGAKSSLKIVGAQEKVDERDVIFSRYYALELGTPRYMQYYKKNPHLKKSDDKIRSLP